MAPVDLETLAMRAVEVTVIGREDPRLLVATKAKLSKPRKVARLLAGLVNAADDRHTLLLIGLRGRQVLGIEQAPDEDWWADLAAGFPGNPPHLDSTTVEIDGAQVLAIAPSAQDEMVAAYESGRIVVPMFDRGGSHRRTRPGTIATARAEPLPTARVLGGWIEREVLEAEGIIHAYRGQLEIELESVTGILPDKTCSTTLLVPSHVGPIELDAQVHPTTDDIGVFRHEDGIEVRTSFRISLYMAGAVRPDPGETRVPGSVQLVVSIMLPGRAEPELRSLLLSEDKDALGARWFI